MTSAGDGDVDPDQALADNHRLWEAWTAVHTRSSFYDVERFRNDPGDLRIDDWEQEEVGAVDGASLLHVQCHFGLDTLSWARLGARVTGVDFSQAAVDFARQLATDVGLHDRARFVAANAYDLPSVLDGERFDIVYTSRGVLGCLPDIGRWGQILASCVAPGGIVYVHEIHPVIQALEEEAGSAEGFRLAYDYWSGDALTFRVEGSYADPSADIDAEWEHGWNHSLGEIVMALTSAGLRLELLDEKPWLDWALPFLEPDAEGRYRLPAGRERSLPLMFSLRARRDR